MLCASAIVSSSDITKRIKGGKKAVIVFQKCIGHI